MGYQEFLVKRKTEKDAIKDILKLEKELKNSFFSSVGKIVVKARISVIPNDLNKISTGDTFILLLGDRHATYKIATTIANKKDIYPIDDIVYGEKTKEFLTPRQKYEHCFADIPMKQVRDSLLGKTL